MKLNPSHPALIKKRTIHQKYVRSVVGYGKPIFKSVADNTKIGKGSNIITKGDWSGMPMFSLTLEERATCPSDCLHWHDCYGNGSMFALRFKRGKDLEARIFVELVDLAKKYKHGFVIRLHILGDFYSVQYVKLWQSMMGLHPNLRVFGYTARHKGNIKRALDRIQDLFPERWWIRVSRNDPSVLLSAHSVPSGNAIPCPEQTGKTESCLTCGLCWKMQKPIYFQSHDEMAQQHKKVIQCSL